MKPYGPSRLKGYIEAPKGVDVQKFLTLRESAMREIADFTALIRFEGGVGSGTFINSGGVNGILTAHHVAREIIKGGFLQLIIAQYAHKLPVSLEFLQHEVIGDSTGNPRPARGPDLSFLRILDVELLGRIRAHKSFLHLDGKDFSFFRRHPKRRMPWFVCGTPYELQKFLGNHGLPPEPLTKLSGFVGEAKYCSLTERAGFDYIKVSVPAGEHNYPSKYGGVSGGGIWMVPFSIGDDEDVNTIQYEAPFLAGVAFYESPMKKGERVITGHGPNSIYNRVTEIIKTP